MAKRILIADDSSFMRRMIRNCFEDELSVAVCGEAADGIEAISIGAGGTGGGAHSLQEWYEPAGREMGLKRALLTLLGVSGLAEEKAR